MSVTELATATDIARPVLDILLKTLQERGEIMKEQLPSGTAGFRRSPEGSPSG